MHNLLVVVNPMLSTVDSFIGIEGVYGIEGTYELEHRNSIEALISETTDTSRMDIVQTNISWIESSGSICCFKASGTREELEKSFENIINICKTYKSENNLNMDIEIINIKHKDVSLGLCFRKLDVIDLKRV